MSNAPFKTHVFQYNYDGKLWEVDIPATSEEDAWNRLGRLQFAEYVGTNAGSVPASVPGSRAYVRLLCWWRNLRA